MTKVDAIKKVLENNNGVAVWSVIYNQIEKYYPNVKNSKDWKAGVRGVLYRDLGKSFKMLDNGLISLLNFDESNLVLVEDIGDTTKSIQSKIRVGQDRFRKNLLKELKYCPVTGIDDNRVLLASHIKPWALSTDFERLDINNGFIFSPTIDKLFDTGLISFENSKHIIISPALSQNNASKIGIDQGKKFPDLPVENRMEYLDYHRKNIFLAD